MRRSTALMATLVIAPLALLATGCADDGVDMDEFEPQGEMQQEEDMQDPGGSMEPEDGQDF